MTEIEETSKAIENLCISDDFIDSSLNLRLSSPGLNNKNETDSLSGNCSSMAADNEPYGADAIEIDKGFKLTIYQIIKHCF